MRNVFVQLYQDIPFSWLAIFISERGLRGYHVRTRHKLILKDVHNRKLFWLV